jgi:Tfp pilus assembly protein PilO
MASVSKKMGPKQEFLAAGIILLLAVAAWYALLYSPVQAKTARLYEAIKSDRDSVKAVENYNAQEAAFRSRGDLIRSQTLNWDSRFPPRDSIVALARTLIDFAAQNNLLLLELQPSLFELYALEREGTQVSGRFVMQLPLKFKMQGRYLDLGKLLESIEELPFNLTVADVAVAPIPEHAPELDISLDVYLYIHL